MVISGKFENNWREKCLDTLEKQKLGNSAYQSDLISKAIELRKKPLSHYKIEDLRIMISQELGLQYLVPLALERLQTDILSEGDFYEGDLLRAVLAVNANFWKQNKSIRNEVVRLFNLNIIRLKVYAEEDKVGKEILELFRLIEQHQ